MSRIRLAVILAVLLRAIAIVCLLAAILTEPTLDAHQTLALIGLGAGYLAILAPLIGLAEQ